MMKIETSKDTTSLRQVDELQDIEWMRMPDLLRHRSIWKVSGPLAAEIEKKHSLLQLPYEFVPDCTVHTLPISIKDSSYPGYFSK